MLVLIALGIFLVVILVLHGLYHSFRAFSRRAQAAEQFKVRMQGWSAKEEAPRASIVRIELFSDIPWLNGWLKKNLQLKAVKKLHLESGTRASLGTYMLGSAACSMLGLSLGLHFHSAFLPALVWAAMFGALPFGLLYHLKARRVIAFQRQMPDSLDLIARALRAGHAFFVGMKIVGEEMSDPTGSEFRRAFDEVSMGVSVPDALKNLASRVVCLDVKYFVTAVVVQRETGGNLADIIEGLGRTIRKRFELHEKVKALSAEGVLSAIVLFVLPFVMAAMEYLTNPTYFDVLFTDALGRQMVGGALLLMTLGAAVTKKLIVIKV
jgi:tight adherence protein B